MAKRVKVIDARTAERPPDTPTMKYVGTDKHAAKVIEGKFSSNVGPRKSHFTKEHERHRWVCVVCDHENREYMVNCFNCNAKTRPF